jgi:hypothetical protein
MSISNWIQSDNGKKILSFIWGLGLSILFIQQCKHRNCIIIQSPSLDDIKGKTFSYTGNEKECYRFEPYFVK